jgi:hypothetical protein
MRDIKPAAWIYYRKIQYQMFYEHNLNPMVNSINYIIVKTVWRYLCTNDRPVLLSIIVMTSDGPPTEPFHQKCLI